MAVLGEGDLLVVVLVVGHAEPAGDDAVVGEGCFEGEGGGVGEGGCVVHAC